MSASVFARHRLLLVGERVLVERQPAVDGPLPQADVVFLAAGEVEQRERELLVGRRRAGRRCSVTFSPWTCIAATTLDLVGPWPTTWITSGSLTNASMIGCASLLLTRMSMSSTVSAGGGGCRTARRGSRRASRESARAAPARAAARGRCGRGCRPVRGTRCPSRIFCCVFAPKPFSFATSPASHAAFSFSMVSIPRLSWSAFTFFGPRPGRRSICDQPARDRGAQVVEVRQLAGGDERGDLLLRAPRRCRGPRRASPPRPSA